MILRGGFFREWLNLAEFHQEILRALGIKEGDTTMGSRHGGAFQKLGAIPFKFFDTRLQIIHLKSEMIERALLGADNRVDRIPTFVRAETEELDEGIP